MHDAKTYHYYKFKRLHLLFHSLSIYVIPPIPSDVPPCPTQDQERHVNILQKFRLQFLKRTTHIPPKIHPMISISLDTAARLAGQTKRHLRRRIAEGSLAKVNCLDVQGRTHIPLDAIRAHIGYPLTAEDITNILNADSGDPHAQHYVALFFLELDDPERALEWLQLSAQKGYPDAMLLLGEAYTAGLAGGCNSELGIDWIKRAAVAGMVLAQEIIAGLKQQAKTRF